MINTTEFNITSGRGFDGVLEGTGAVLDAGVGVPAGVGEAR